MAIDLKNRFLSSPTLEKKKRIRNNSQSCGQIKIFIYNLFHDPVNSLPYIIPVPSHNIVQRNVDHLDSPTEHYSDSLHWHHRTDWAGRVRGVCKTLVLQRVGDKYYEDSGNCRFNKVFRSLIGMWQDSPSKNNQHISES